MFARQQTRQTVCNICEKVYKCKGGVTTPLHNHLKTHSEEFKEFEAVKSKNKKNDEQSSKTPKQSTLHAMFPKSNEATRKLLDEKIVDFLAESGVAFRTIGLQSFKDIIHAVNNKIEVKSNMFYSKLVGQKSDEIRSELLSIVEYMVSNGVDTVSFTTDLWTSVNNDPFICLTMQFVYNWQLFTFTPYVKPFPDKHSGQNISICLDEMIEQLGLDNPRLHLFSINDNASNMKLAIKSSQYLTEYNCDIHTLELVIKDGVKNSEQVQKVLKKTKAIAKYVSKSSVASSDLKKACEDDQINRDIRCP